MTSVNSLVSSGHERSLIGGRNDLACERNDQEHNERDDAGYGGGGPEGVPQHKGIHNNEVEYIGGGNSLAVLDPSGLRVTEDDGLPRGLSDCRVLVGNSRGLPVDHSSKGHGYQGCLNPQTDSPAPIAILRLHQNLEQSQSDKYAPHVVVAPLLESLRLGAGLQACDKAPQRQRGQSLQRVKEHLQQQDHQALQPKHAQ
ncbi:hypothetical protein OIY81_2985 [Cryptosporidium canis]|nr:hypothetical protein OIY81_2985 [Cryptosporidium canis]